MLSLTHRDTESAFSSSVCTWMTTTGLVASSQFLRWWFSSILAGPVRMLGVGYREVNQDQSSDPLALFRTSKAYSFLFSQYTLVAISAVSPDTALYMCVTACMCGKSYEESGSYIHTTSCLRIQSHDFSHTYVWGRWASLATSWLRVYFEEAGARGPLLTHACKWQNITAYSDLY